MFDDSGDNAGGGRWKRTPSKRNRPAVLPIQSQPSGVWSMPLTPVGAPAAVLQLVCCMSMTGGLLASSAAEAACPGLADGAAAAANR